MARNEVPAECENRTEELCWRASHVLRYAAYVGRSGMACRPGLKGPGRYVFTYDTIHAKMALDLWVAEHKAAVIKNGLLLPGDPCGPGMAERFPGVEYAGILMMYPPRHGKTAILRHWVGLKISRNPRLQCAYIHARDREAQAFKRNVSSLFTDDNIAGRRNLSLFPGIGLADYDNNAHSLRLKTDDPPKNPSLMAASIDAHALGNDLDLLIGDDLVPRSDAEQPTERERRKERWAATWMTRLQGDGFCVVSGYPCHHDDLVWTIHQQARRAAGTNGQDGMMFLLSKEAVGGPSTRPAFRPAWRSVYPAGKLRAIFRSLHNPAIWSANYMLNPITDDMRLVKSVEFYEERPEHDPFEHERFLERAEFHLSIDPSYFTPRVTDTRLGYCGLVLLAIGDIERREATPAGMRVASRTVIRVLRAEEFRATQLELAGIIADMARSRRVDWCHVETVGGGGAVRQFLSSVHNIESVIEHTTGNRSKEQRLRAVAPMLEASWPDLRPVVQFPGVREDGGDGPLSVHPRCRKLHEYIINFRAMSGHHSLDALTQVLSYLAPRCGFGSPDQERIVGPGPEPAPSLKREPLDWFRDRDEGPAAIMAYAGGAGA